MLKFMFAFVLALVALQGLNLLIKAMRGLQQARASTVWPRTEGIVVRADEIRHDITYTAAATVRYAAADGKVYSTGLVSFGQTLKPSDRLDAALQLVRYSEGSKVSVSYDPAEPSVAVLHPGVHSEAYWPVGVALAFLLPALLCLTVFPGLARAGKSNQAAKEMFERASQQGGRVSVSLPPGSQMPNLFAGVTPIAGLAAAIFAGLVFGLGVLALANGLTKGYYGFGSQSWPVAPGEVLVNAGYHAPMKGDFVIYSPSFLYQYEVDGIKHVNTLTRFRSVRTTGDEESEIMAPSNMPVGKKVSVAYFPMDPDISVLQPGVNGQALVMPGIGVVMMLFGLAVFTWMVPSLLAR